MFAYTVLAGDESDTDGVALGPDNVGNSVDLNGGMITVAETGADATVAYTRVPSDSGHRVNWARPTLSGAVTSRDGTEVLLTFSENLDPGGFSLTLFTVKVDGTAVTLSGTVATVSGSRVTVPLATALTSATQTVTVSYADPTTGDDHTVQDLAGNDADSFTDQMVTNAFGTTTTPTVTADALTSTPGSDNTYGIGDEIAATVSFSEAVDITGAPQLELDFAGTPKAANCAAATNTTTMVCRYTVVQNDSAPNGIAIAANKLTLNGGTITATGSTTINAALDHAAVAIDAGQKVDGIRPTLVTSGANAPTTSTDGTKVILRFSEDIGSVDRTDIAIFHSGGVAVPTSNDSISGRTVEITLTTALTDSTTSLEVDLAVGAVTDAVGNANAILVGTTVLNQVSAAPSAPIGLTAEPAPDKTPQLAVDLSWTAPTSDGGSAITSHQYRYLRNNGSFGAWTTINDSGANGVNATSFTVRGLSAVNNALTTFTFEVRAINDNGNGAESDPATATIDVPDDVVSTLIPGNGQIKVEWPTPGEQRQRHPPLPVFRN